MAINLMHCDTTSFNIYNGPVHMPYFLFNIFLDIKPTARGFCIGILISNVFLLISYTF